MAVLSFEHSSLQTDL